MCSSSSGLANTIIPTIFSTNILVFNLTFRSCSLLIDIFARQTTKIVKLVDYCLSYKVDILNAPDGLLYCSKSQRPFKEYFSGYSKLRIRFTIAKYGVKDLLN